MKIWSKSLGPEVKVKLPDGPSSHTWSLPLPITHTSGFFRGDTFDWIDYLFA